MEYRSALTLKPFDTIEIPGIGTKQIGAIEQIRENRYRIRLEEKFVESIVIDVLTQSAPEQRTPERHEGPWQDDPDSSAFRAGLRAMIDLDGPTNTVIQTQLGVGSIAMLTETLHAAGAKWLSVLGPNDIAELETPVAGGEGVLPTEALSAADTLLVHDAGRLSDDLAALLSEIAEERTLRGLALPNLKRVILVYPGYGDTLPKTAVPIDGSRFRTIELIR